MSPEVNLTPFGADDTLVIAIDNVGDTAETLKARRDRQRATFQIVGRGPGGNSGTRMALQGTLLPGDRNTERGALRLLKTLNEMAREASSRVLTGPDPLTASMLRPMRELATRQTLHHLAELDRDPWDLSHGPLSVAFGMSVHPLVVVQGSPQDRYSHRKNVALDSAGVVPTGKFIGGKVYEQSTVVAIVIPEDSAIHFMTVAQGRNGKRRVEGMTIFAPPPPVPEHWMRTTPVPSAYVDAAVFTD